MNRDARHGYWQRKAAAASARGRRMARARWDRERAKRLDNPPDVDADTVRQRELHDRMGKLIFAGQHAIRGRVEIRHSTERTNGYELWIEGRLVARTGKRKIMEELL
ncbi:MAG TPA: hypothetical protein VK178_07175 [Opitutaceae bacterium]|nr:hypothetical protein [Opitutaceae bacterium]